MIPMRIKDSSFSRTSRDARVFAASRARLAARTRACNFAIFVASPLRCVCMSFAALSALAYSSHTRCSSLASKEVMTTSCDDDFSRIFSCSSHRRSAASRAVAATRTLASFSNTRRSAFAQRCSRV